MNKPMKKEGSLDYLSEVSYEVKEILGKPPNRLVQWGITVIFIIIVIFFVASAFIEYNDIVKAKITITTKQPPAYIEAKTSGRLEGFFVKTGDSVQEGQILAEIENTGSLKDVFWLKNKIDQFSTTLISLDSINTIFPSSLKLGDINKFYSDFISKYQAYVIFNTLKPNQKSIVVAERQVFAQQELLSLQRNQLEFFVEELKLSKIQFQRSKMLYHKGVISKSEFENASRNLLTDKQKFESLKTNISNTIIAIENSYGNKTQNEILKEQLSYSYSQELRASIEVLKNEIDRWELLYVLKSPICGKLTLFDIRNKYENVKRNDVIFTVVPYQNTDLIGSVSMPIKNSGKVKIGQDVLIKLDNYPYQEWGSLKGKIVDISAVPTKKEALYSIHVNINNLVTTFGKDLEFKQEMQGVAEIITEELSILERVFYQFKSVLDQIN